MDIIESKMLRKLTKKGKKTDISILKTKPASYFYSKPSDKQDFVRSRLLRMRECFLEVLKIPYFKPVSHQSHIPFYTFGMISSPTGTKLESEIFLFNSTDESNVPVRLDLSAVDSYSLFNGQIVALKGTNMRGDVFRVEEIYTKCTLNMMDTSNSPKSEVDIIVCKGPFSVSLVERLFSESADAFIFMGPFCGTGENEFTQISSFTRLLEICMEKSRNQGSVHQEEPKVIMITSLDDYFSLKVFPQPIPKISTEKIILLPNPGYINLNSHVISLCNFDNFIDLCYEEIHKQVNETPFNNDERVQRLASHMIFQQSFVPVLRSKSTVAYGDWLEMDVVPDLYIIASKMKGFEKEVGPTTVMNVGPTTVMNVGPSHSQFFKVHCHEQAGYQIEKYKFDPLQVKK